MPAPPDAKADAALETLRDWEWRRCDPDGVPFHPGMELNYVISRLALEGLTGPDEAVLNLLCRGDLVARGCYRWRRYQSGNFYQLEGVNEILKPLRWQHLAGLISDEWEQLAGPGWPDAVVNLEKLNMTKCPIYEWEFSDNRFATATCAKNMFVEERGYFEEWFSAWELEVWPNDTEPDTLDDDHEPEPARLGVNKGGRPTAANWEAAALEFAGRYYKGDFKPTDASEVAKALTEWLAAQNRYPANSTIQHHASVIFAALQSWEQD